MKIYTKTGDDGTTGLFGGGRVAKDDARVEAYGTVDETNSAVGLARSLSSDRELDELLGSIQVDLFAVGAELACVPGKEEKLGATLLDPEAAVRLEQAIDRYELLLAPLRHFVLPGGSAPAAALHHVRTVCRRAERRVITLSRLEPVRQLIVVYLNRLSDLAFVLARACNHQAGVADVPWIPRPTRT
jgi:cob(I)alamin adenosyltransferase